MAERLGPESRTTFRKIAEECHLDEDDTKRILRLAMTEHYFKELESGIVVHSAATQMLEVNPLLAAWVGLTTDENWPSMVYVSS